ncbi:hypothetical protein ILT44_03255 [Microvirga sp. BT689]|uniref:hypothetical protein n=1 Tax=Microvirga arvi TaxID=2778731 RepID=UPI00194F8AD7|nr:hypothetical protein [Microvirga arvi]MBM6579190.1 hypothetical protein [Microvirga arvi]
MSINKIRFRRIAFPVAMLVMVWVKLFEDFGYKLPDPTGLVLATLLLGLVLWALPLPQFVGAAEQSRRKLILILGLFLTPAVLYLIAMIAIGDRLGLSSSQAWQLGLAISATPVFTFVVWEGLRANEHHSAPCDNRDQD